MKEELVRKAAELEETLEMQFNVVKKESETWVRIGAGVLVGGLIGYGIYKLLSKNKKPNKTEKVLQTLAKEGLLDEEIRKKLTQKQSGSSGLLGNLGAFLLPFVIDYGKQMLTQELQKQALVNNLSSTDEPLQGKK
jgi:uncharacterized membrane-anchored protein YhcB (DUF1043 family)